MADVKAGLERLLSAEGGALVTNDNNHGAARWGITERFAGDVLGVEDTATFVRALTYEQAYNIYHKQFVMKKRLDQINDQRIFNALLFAWVNVWFYFPTKFAQLAINEVHPTALVEVDGKFGPQTTDALNSLDEDGVKLWIVAFNGHMLKDWYEKLAEKNPALYADDLSGWTARLAKAVA